MTGAVAELAARLADGSLARPQDLLGCHRELRDGNEGTVLRCWHPEAVAAELLGFGGAAQPMRALAPGLFELFLPRPEPPRFRYRLQFRDGARLELEDPYRFASTLGELDLHLFAEGTHRRLWEMLGAHPRHLDGVDGVSFAVWAPRARRVSVVGDFCHWDGRVFPMCARGASGIFELFLPEVRPGDLYKFEIRTQQGELRVKSDPLAFAMEQPPATASRVTVSGHQWQDADWMDQRIKRDPRREPLSMYEVHLGSWQRHEDGRRLSYRELAPRLADHVQQLGFTHVELMPVMEHPLEASWGYQVTGYFAPSARFGHPDDLRFLVDHLHRRHIGVVLDWVPAHFPRDDFALRRFDGEPLYEYPDPRLGEHPDWGTLVFDFGRPEVRNFLIANALYWLDEFHADGLRVDAVASMLYRDYSRREGEWLPNVHGGRENYEAQEFLRGLNDAVGAEFPGCFTVAEESTAWPGVTAPTEWGGLGFTFKWNMGWMHDTLEYFERDPVHRAHHHDGITFAALYENSESFLMPLSHDEVVHGKHSLLEKMPGDPWQKYANLRLLLTYQYTRPGKKLLFMGTELAPREEWNHELGLDWGLAREPARQGIQRLLRALADLYRRNPCLWRSDPDPAGFRWVDHGDREQSVLAYERHDAGASLVTVMNATPVPRTDYRIGVPEPGVYRELLCSDAQRFGGSGFETLVRVHSEPHPYHGLAHSVRLALPPLGALVLARES